MILKIIIFDITLLIINIYLLIFLKNDFFHKRNIDNFYINFSTKSFYQMSDYLNRKYLNPYNPNDISKTDKTYISLYFIQFHKEPFHKKLINNIIKLIKKKYFIYIDPKGPDYLIYNVFGCKYLNSKYNNSIKIAYITENQMPDFNKADYFIGNSHIIYLDRYFRMPFYFIDKISLLKIKEAIESIRKEILSKKIRTKFCAAVISNDNSTDSFRLTFIKELNKYKIVDMGGSINNNVGKIKDKLKFLTSYKFSVAMENSEGEGYLSEKIIDSFLSGTIPIYYGDYMVDEFINPEAYILIRGKKDIKKKIEYIKEIDNNDELYKNIIKKKVLLINDYKAKITKEYTAFFEHIFEQNKQKAKRIDNYYF